MALLEPFIDTIIICTLTGLVILSSGVWSEKFDNQFQTTDMVVMDRVYDDQVEADHTALHNFLLGHIDLPEFTGSLDVKEGVVQNELTILHARSIAENVLVKESNEPFTGTIPVVNGVISSASKQTFEGKSLVHSAPLTTIAFTKSWFGDYGKYIVAIGLLLFAFSTAISWSYYGDRAIAFLFGSKGVVYFRIVYVFGFFIAAFTDTTIIWTLSGIAIALMTIPNLIGILLLRKEMKSEVKSFWLEYSERFPDEKAPVD